MHSARSLWAASLVTVWLAAFSASTQAAQDAIDEGKALAFDVKKGNCLACHAIAGGELAGNIGPALVGMQQRYPDKAALRAQIADAGRRNPSTVMPPFGRHAILTDDELNKVVDFIYTR